MNAFFRPGPHRRATGILIALALVAAGCSAGRGVSKPMQLRVLEGSARILRGDTRQTIRSEAAVRKGDRIIQSKSGIAELRLAPGRVFEITGADVEVPANNVVKLSKGDLLATVTADARVTGSGIEVLSKQSTFRVDRFLSTRVGVYSGKAELRTGAGSLPIPRLRQAIVAGEVVARTAKPLRIDSSDPWDRRFLQDALDLDVRLSNFGRGLEAQLGAGGGLPFFSQILPGNDLGFLAPFLSGRRSDLLIGLAVAEEASKSGGRSLAGTFSNAYSLWTDGATWGLIAYELGVARPSIFTILLGAVKRAGIRLGGGGGAGAPRPSPTPAPTAKPSTPPPKPGPSPTPTPTQPPGPTQPIEDIVNQIVKQLLPTPPPLIP